MRPLWVLFTALVLFGPQPSAGAAETARLLITINDNSGRPVVNADVSVANPGQVPGPQPGRTGPDGTVGFTLEAGANYTVRVSASGFTARTSDPFDLHAGVTKSLQFTLQPEIVETVKVRAGIVDLNEGGQQKMTFPSDLADDLPILGRSYQNLLTLAPGVNDANHDGNPNVHGARERDFKATVDGVSNVDPLTGTYMSEVNADAIAEVEVVTTGAPAEYGGATGGFGRILTKQGTNSFAGSAGVYLRSSFFDGASINSGTDTAQVAYHDVRTNLNITGPIVQDKLFFAFFHEYLDQGRPVNLVNGSGLVIATKGSRNLDKLTWQVDPRNKVTFQFQADPLSTGPLGIDSQTDALSGYDYQRGGPGYQLRWDFQQSSNFFLQSAIGLSHMQVAFRPQTDGVNNGCAVDEAAAGFPSQRHDFYGNLNGPSMEEDYCFEETTALRRGSYYRNYSDDRIRYTFKSDASYFLENFFGTSHTLRAGVIAERKQYDGSQSLRPVSDWREEPPSIFNGGAIGNGTIARTVYVPGYPSFQANTAEGSNYGVYVEDQFRPHPNVSIRLGVRVDQENLAADGFEHFDPALEDAQFTRSYEACVHQSPSPDRCARAAWHVFHEYEVYPANGAFALASVVQDPAAGLQPREPERFRISNTNLAPRFSISWDPGTEGRGKIFGTAGRYYGEIFLAVPSFEQGPDSFLFTYPVEGEPVNCHSVPGDPNALDCDYQSVIGPDSSAQVASASIRQVDRNLKTPYQDEYTAGVSWEVMRETSLTVTGIRRDFRDQLQDIDVNHFIITSHFRGFTFHDYALHNPFFNEILRVGNYNASDYRALQFELNRRLRNNWELNASYVSSKATGNAEDYDQTLGNDPGLVTDEFGYLDYDQRSVFKLSARSLLPQWNLRFGSALTWQSGRPYSIVEEGFSYDLPRRYGTTVVYFAQQRTTYPTHQRNDQRNEGYFTIDLGLRKDFAVGKASLQVSFDVFNLLNDNTLYIQEIRNGQVVAYRNAGRQIQFGAKIAF